MIKKILFFKKNKKIKITRATKIFIEKIENLKKYSFLD